MLPAADHYTSMLRRCGVVLLMGLGACVNQAPKPPAQFSPPLCSASELPTHGITGLSGMSESVAGRWFAIAEDRYLLEYSDEAAGASCLHRHSGVLPGPLEFESVAQLPGGRLIVGSEHPDAPQAASQLLELVREGDGYTTKTFASMAYKHWPGAVAEANRGIEGLCAFGDWLVVGSERVAEGPEGRRAPVGFLHVPSGRWSRYWLPLVSASGRVSSVGCWLETGAGEPAVELAIIERTRASTDLHLGRLPLEGVEAGLSEAAAPRVLSGLAHHNLKLHFGNEAPNLEGLRRRGSTLWGLNDNNYGGRSDLNTRQWPISQWLSR